MIDPRSAMPNSVPPLPTQLRPPGPSLNPSAPKPTAPPPGGRVDTSSLSLIESTSPADSGVSAAVASKIKYDASCGGSTRKFTRPTDVSGHGAVRVKTFHGRLSDESLQYVDDKINEWLDSHPEIEVKFVTSTCGLFDGKIKDLAMILNVWY